MEEMQLKRISSADIWARAAASMTKKSRLGCDDSPNLDTSPVGHQLYKEEHEEQLQVTIDCPHPPITDKPSSDGDQNEVSFPDEPRVQEPAASPASTDEKADATIDSDAG